ncbi:MAG: hypothetical protein HC929_25625 [Leptolyngbyaceae cyanobacterium SM2_5_2]|nr:hypothetical protein [Leptolyngbyaceae cyanobacterium SM2_5_2]
MKYPNCLVPLLVLATLGFTAPALAVTLTPTQTQSSSPRLTGLFHVLDVAEDVDDLLDGDIGQIDPIRDVVENVEDGVDDVQDTIYDVTHINIIEPFTDVDDQYEDFVDDVDDSIRHASNDVNDWFDW